MNRLTNISCENQSKIITKQKQETSCIVLVVQIRLDDDIKVPTNKHTHTHTHISKQGTKFYRELSLNLWLVAFYFLSIYGGSLSVGGTLWPVWYLRYATVMVKDDRVEGTELWHRTSCTGDVIVRFVSAVIVSPMSRNKEKMSAAQILIIRLCIVLGMVAAVMTILYLTPIPGMC